MGNIPSGTVTFLFTDIEGSTKRWEQYPQQMKAGLQRHDLILHAAIEANGGYVFKTVGDAFCAAFSSPHHALNAALASQRALHNERWPGEIGTVKVRMALHTGVADEQGGDYFGQPLNRVARLLTAGHGGQTLLSLATQELIRDTLPAGVGLRDLREHRLKDLYRPERIFQLVAHDLPGAFPPLKTLDSRPNNLPLQPTPLIGREKEVGAAKTLLSRDDVRLVTLTGPGGTGKTRLALQVVADSIDEFSGGVWFVNLAPVSEPGLVVSTIAQTLGVMEAGGRLLVESLKDYLGDKEVLLLLDNFEQVVEARTQVVELLSAAPRLKVLITSRVALQVRGEREWPVPPLSLPDPAHLPPIERLNQYEAVSLFIERATDIKPDFRVTNENAPAVAEICARLDGLPLAVELAAARIRLLTPQAMLSRLQSRLKLLTGGLKDLPARQQTLRKTIEWSHDLLSEGEKQLFRRLAVFQGGRSLEAIDQVCNVGAGDWGLGISESLLTRNPQSLTPLDVDVLEGVESLLTQSLLRQVAGVSGEPRYVMLETIHEHAREKLEESDEGEDVRRRHALYFTQLAEALEMPMPGPPNLVFLDRLEEEHDNIRAALLWAIDNREVDLALRLSGAVAGGLWHPRAYFTEGRRWLETILSLQEVLEKAGGKANAMPRTMPSMKTLRAKVLLKAANFAYHQEGSAVSQPLAKESLTLYSELGDRHGMARALIQSAFGEADNEVYLSQIEESMRLFKEVGDKAGTAYALYQLASWHSARDEKLGRAYLLETLALARETGDHTIASWSLSLLGHYALREGDYQTARAMFSEGLDLMRRSGNKINLRYPLNHLGFVAMEEGDYATAGALFEEALTLAREAGTKGHAAESYINLAVLRYLQSDYEQVRVLAQESLELQRGIGENLDWELFTISLDQYLLGLVALHEDDSRSAEELFRKSLEAALGMDFEAMRKSRIFFGLVGCARAVALRAEQKQRGSLGNGRAAKLLGAAQAVRESFHQHETTEDRVLERLEHERVLATVRAQMDQATWLAGWDEGHTMSMEEIIEYALADPAQE